MLEASTEHYLQDFEQKATELKQETERISGDLWRKESQQQKPHVAIHSNKDGYVYKFHW